MQVFRMLIMDMMSCYSCNVLIRWWSPCRRGCWPSSRVEYAVSPESLTCAIEERYVQDDQQHVNNAGVTNHAHARHALSRSQPATGSGDRWKFRWQRRRWTRSWNCRHQLSAVASRSSPTPHSSCFATSYTTSQTKTSNSPKTFQTRVEKYLIP